MAVWKSVKCGTTSFLISYWKCVSIRRKTIFQNNWHRIEVKRFLEWTISFTFNTKYTLRFSQDCNYFVAIHTSYGNRCVVKNSVNLVFSASENCICRVYFYIDRTGKRPPTGGMHSELIKHRFVMNYCYDIPVVSRLDCTYLRSNANEIYDFNCTTVWLIKRNRTWLKFWSCVRRGDRQHINNNRRLICMHCVKHKSR